MSESKTEDNSDIVVGVGEEMRTLPGSGTGVSRCISLDEGSIGNGLGSIPGPGTGGSRPISLDGTGVGEELRNIAGSGTGG